MDKPAEGVVFGNFDEVFEEGGRGRYTTFMIVPTFVLPKVP